MGAAVFFPFAFFALLLLAFPGTCVLAGGGIDPRSCACAGAGAEEGMNGDPGPSGEGYALGEWMVVMRVGVSGFERRSSGGGCAYA